MDRWRAARAATNVVQGVCKQRRSRSQLQAATLKESAASSDAQGVSRTCCSSFCSTTSACLSDTSPQPRLRTALSSFFSSSSLASFDRSWFLLSSLHERCLPSGEYGSRRRAGCLRQTLCSLVGVHCFAEKRPLGAHGCVVVLLSHRLRVVHAHCAVARRASILPPRCHSPSPCMDVVHPKIGPVW